MGKYVACQSPNLHWKQTKNKINIYIYIFSPFDWKFTPFGWEFMPFQFVTFLVEVFKLDTSQLCVLHAAKVSTTPVELRESHSSQNITICWNHPKSKNFRLIKKAPFWGLAPPKVHFSSNINYCCLVCSIWKITVMTPIFLWVEPCLDHAPVTVKLMAQWLPIKHPQSKYVRWNPPTYCGWWINTMRSGKQSHTSTGKLPSGQLS